MGFPIKSEPLSEDIAENVVKETPEIKTEPVVQPVNADIDKSLLGKGPELVAKAQNTTSLGLRQGASTVNTTARPAKHVVSLRDLSNNDTKKYNFLVHCDTCGWEGRYAKREIAETVIQNHKDKHYK